VTKSKEKAIAQKPRRAKSKIRSLQALIRELSLRRSKSRSLKVVLTNGCFDLLHAGHVDYLERARRLGDLLVVAVNSDDSVRRLKGPTRPLNCLDDRMRVLGALECVDFVIFFQEDTPLKLIQKLTPQVLVKGGDYRADQVVGAEWVLEHGGRVRILPFLKGRSTTAVIERASTKHQKLVKKI
jgi:D-beta-D-heptose 7-phosphate kinase/D-beta-D-heptose 1-phosphate adenosyltransferase